VEKRFGKSLCPGRAAAPVFVDGPARGAGFTLGFCGAGGELARFEEARRAALDRLEGQYRQALGRAGEGVVALSLLLFAFSSILGWSYYGQQCLAYLAGGRKLIPAYRAVFLLCVILGAVWEPEAVWLLADLCNALMALPNLAALLLLAPEALSLLEGWRRAASRRGSGRILQKKEKPY